MKKSSIVQLGLTSAMAAALLGCGRREVANCVDESDHVVDDKYCDEMDRSHSAGVYPVVIPYRWYYGGMGLMPGMRASGGSYTPSPGLATVRGGFGGTGAADGAGGGGE
jgi:hypothetical protein